MTDETPPIPETLAQYLTENQDPEQVARIYEKVSQLLTRGEQVIYIAVQKALTYDPTPEIVVLTNRRFTRLLNNVPNWRPALTTMLRWYREEGGRRVVVNSDAHRVGQMGANLDLAATVLRDAGLTAATLQPATALAF